MTLTLRVSSYQDRTPEEHSITVGHEGCSIGRAPDNNFVLPDEDRIVSHQHATIYFENGNYYLSDNSTNGTFINRAPDPVGRGHSVKLNDGDTISIGEYECQVSLRQEEAGIPMPEAGLTAEPPGQLWGAGAEDNQQEIPPPYAIPEPLANEEKPAPEKIPKDFDYLSPAVSTAEKHDAAVAAEHGTAEQQFFQPPQAIPEDWDVQAEKTPEPEPEPVPLITEPIQEKAKPKTRQPKQKKKTPAAKQKAPSDTTASNQAVAAF